MSKMFLFKFLCWFIFILCFILYLLPLFLKKETSVFNKTSTLEAGFFTSGKIKQSFSVQFIFLMLIFILFDTEILFTFGLALSFLKIFWINFLIFLFLVGTLFMEWKWNKLLWLV